jgi:hypothetical protein
MLRLLIDKSFQIKLNYVRLFKLHTNRFVYTYIYVYNEIYALQF